jgi:hypothetical protein
MSRRLRKARRRRKWARRRDAAKSPLGEMNQALGEFLTAMGRVEFTMLMVVDLVSDAGIDALFDEYAGKTFGGKIKWFKEWCAHRDEHFSDANRKLLQTTYKDLDELLPKRNSLVHGETYEEEFHGRGKQSYRVGVEKDNLEYLEEFSRGQKKGTIFDVQEVREATKLCARIRADLNTIRGVTAPLW